jgi:hypothetical protein
MKTNVVISILLCGIATSQFLQAEEVHVGDIGGKLTLIGRLGKPLGVIAAVDGQLVSEPRQGKSGTVTAAFRVNKVDGKPLEKGQIVGLVFRASTPFHADELLHLSGYEGGAFVGTPDEARGLLGREASPLPWHFESTIRVIKAEKAK